MERNVFVRATALTCTRGRIAYMTSPNKQEHLEAYVSNMPKGGWLELSKYSRHQAALYNPGDKVCEARELMIMLPNSFALYNAQHLAIRLRDDFSNRYRVPCAVAIHWNKAENNYHVHLVFSERSIHRQVQGTSVATRNTYFDANGKRSAKKECLDELGNLKPGCRFVAKGEALSEGSRFGTKKNMFAQEEWLHQEKQRMVDFFNAYDRHDTWKVYDWKSDPHFPYVRIYKGETEDLQRFNAWSECENAWRHAYNDTVDRLIETGELTPQEALELKFKTLEYKRRLRRERAENRRRWEEEWSQRRERAAAERQYACSLRQKGTLGLLFEAALVIAGVDTVKLRTGVERPISYSQVPIKAYRDPKVQAMVDSMYKTVDKDPPFEELQKLAAGGNLEAKMVLSEIEKKRDKAGGEARDEREDLSNRD